MTRPLFLARPVTHADAREVAWALSLRDALVSDGALVRLGGLSTAATDAEAAEQNIEGVTRATALVAVLPRSEEATSSVWVEVGLALAASIPVLLIQGVNDRPQIPFVVASLIGSARHRVVLIDGDEPRQVAVRVLHTLQMFEDEPPHGTRGQTAPAE